MTILSEIQILTNIRLSDIQKYILAKLVLPNATPLTKYSEISGNKNLVANRDLLVKLGMIKLGANEAEITEKGLTALRNENIIDENGNLTPTGEIYAYSKTPEEAERKIEQQTEEPPPSPEETNVPGPETVVADVNKENPLDLPESFNLIKEINKISKEK